jgi:hypothetical protein
MEKTFSMEFTSFFALVVFLLSSCVTGKGFLLLAAGGVVPVPTFAKCGKNCGVLHSFLAFALF